MRHEAGNGTRRGRPGSGPVRFARISPRDSRTAQLLHGCPVTAADGGWIGDVDHLMVDASTRQLRYVVLRDAAGSAAVTIPWQSLYFDAALARLVFYT